MLTVKVSKHWFSLIVYSISLTKNCYMLKRKVFNLKRFLGIFLESITKRYEIDLRSTIDEALSLIRSSLVNCILKSGAHVWHLAWDFGQIFLSFCQTKKKTEDSSKTKNVKNVNVTKNVNEDIKQSPKINWVVNVLLKKWC